MYQVSKTTLKNLLSEKQYTKLRSLYHKTHHLFGNPRFPGFLSTLPDFIILGAQKCGTSSLYSYLASHPQVIPASCKEVHFFDNNFEKGELWYRSHFPFRIRTFLTDYVTGEASPYYLYHPHVARRIHNVSPRTKLIILLRDPVDRAISHYWHEVTWCESEELPMEEAFAHEEDRLSGEKKKLLSDEHYYSYNHQHYSYLDRGRYTHQIERFRKYFDDENILIMNSHSLFTKTQDAYQDVTDFLDIDRHRLDDDQIRMEGSYKKETPKSVRNELEEFYRDEKAQIEKEIGITFE